MELFFYLFKAIEQGLTERQATMIAYLVDFMRVIPNSTLDTLREVCDTKTLPYAEHLKDAPPITQDFFKNQFLSADQLVRQTKSQIANRLYSLCRNQMFISMFNAPDNKFDAFRAMQDKKDRRRQHRSQRARRSRLGGVWPLRPRPMSRCGVPTAESRTASGADHLRRSQDVSRRSIAENLVGRPRIDGTIGCKFASRKYTKHSQR